MDKLTSQARNLNGSYTIETDPVPAAAQNIKLIGTGTECLADGRPVKVVMMVYPDSILNVGAEGH
jgi:hypothetical protein